MLSLDQQVQLALGHVRRHLTRQIGRQARGAAWEAFDARLARHFPALLRELAGVYGARADFLDVLARVVATAWQGWRERPADLRALDAAREAQPHWFQSERMLGGVCYVELYAGNLRGLMAQIPYFKELGLTYLHLMPPFLCPADNSDGGYAVSSYREIDPALGTIDDLRALAAALRREGISLVLDFIFNHTADEHAWARAAVAGEEAFRDFYLIFPDRTLPDAYDRTLREIFPDQHPGAFTQLDDGRWIWTTFNSFQWDLNYANPAVFDAMAGEMLAIANLGAEILRMDAVAFIWKQLGTDCENLPQAHALIRAFNAVCRIAAPGAAVQVRGHRAPGPGGEVHRARGMPALLQPAADGAAVEQPGHPRGQPAAAGAGGAPRPARGHRLGQLRAQPRRHRVDLCGAGQCRRAGRAEAEDTVARRHDASGLEPAGVHAAACGAGSPAASASHQVPRRAGAQRQAAVPGGAARARGGGTGHRSRCRQRMRGPDRD
ncbi:hypothetical protein QMTAC487_21950 [Sphaerotilus sp. FB-3]|nr:alpha-amylase family glycosyl hydrolase [Sphaerotilus sp. FB-3]GKQ58335.1 hypothetical protein QMTAC487_21950 [Sphaerotilus sp. FB-3]